MPPLIPPVPWPLRLHALTALLVVASALLLATRVLDHLSTRRDAATADIRRAQAAAQAIDAHRLPDFAWQLPAASRVDALARDLIASTTPPMQLRSVAVRRQPASDHAIGRSTFDLGLSSPYPEAKHWLAQLLQAWPALGVQSLAVRAGSAGVDVQMSLVLHTRD